MSTEDSMRAAAKTGCIAPLRFDLPPLPYAYARCSLSSRTRAPQQRARVPPAPAASAARAPARTRRCREPPRRRPRDARALRAAALRRELAQALDVALSPDEDPGLVAFADPRTQRALESMLSSRVGDVGVQAFERVYART